MSDSAESVIREFCAAWSRLDVDELAGYFTEDAVYHNMPVAPIRGRERIRAGIASFIASWDRTEWEIVNIAADGDTVFAERIDHIWSDDGGEAHLPVVGVFELVDGKIARWRDYFDMATYTKAVG